MFNTGNAIEELGNRKQLTRGECNLFSSIAAYILLHGLDKYIEVVQAYEHIQELHRINWRITLLTHKQTSDDQQLLLTMLEILPRIDYCDASKYMPEATEHQAKIEISCESSVLISVRKKLM